MKKTLVRSWFLFAAGLFSALVLLPQLALATLSPVPASETVIFSDDFDNNDSNWSNIGTANNHATIGIDPQLPGITAWYPTATTAAASFPGVYSMIRLAEPPNLRLGAVSVYMRARVWTPPPPNANILGENNKFTLVLAEDNGGVNAVLTTATNALGQLIVKPTYEATRWSKIGYAWTNAANLVTNQLEVDLPPREIFSATNYADYRLTMWATNVDGSMTLRAYVYNTNTLTWDPYGPPAKQGWLGSGIFNMLQMIARNAANTSSRSNNVRSFFDSVAVSFYSFTNLPPSSTWYIYNPSPADGALFAPAGSLSFQVGAYSPNFVPQSAIKVYLNQQDITASVTITGNNTNWLVSYNGVPANRAHEVKVVLTDSTGATRTRTWGFSTLAVNAGRFLDLENYNYGMDGGCGGSPALVTLPTAGGDYSEWDVPNPYLFYVGLPGADYFDFSTTNNIAGTNAYRPCDLMALRVSKDELHEPFISAIGIDYDLSHVGAGEWVNITREANPGVYRIYLRAAAIKPQLVHLDRVTGQRRLPGQTTQPVGVFNVPETGSAIYRTVPLTDLAGNELTLAIDQTNTWRVTFSGQVNSIWANALILVPDTGTPGPIVARAEPAPGSTWVDRHTSIKAQVSPGQAALNAGSVTLWLDGVNVTASTVSTVNNGTVNLEYLPPAWFAANSTHTVAVTASDSGGRSVSNAWTFTASPRTAFGTWRINFQKPTSITPAGYLGDAGAVYDDRGAGNFYGWDSNNVVKATELLVNESPTFAHDTYNLFNAVPGFTRVWEFALANGSYDIYGVAGDPTAFDAPYSLTAEGELFLDGAPTPQAPFVEGSRRINVTDGRLTITTPKNTASQKLNFLEIAPAISLPISAPSLTGAGFSVSFPTQPRRPYEIEYKTDLGGGWSSAGTVIGDGSVKTFTDATAVGQPGRYYRVVGK